jgi:hypothetical protein
VFNKNMTTAQHGYVMVDPNDKGAWQKLELEVPTEEIGYIYIYVINESMDNVDVYFDDALVRRSGSVGGEVQLIDAPLTSASDYYPFGLAMADSSYSSEKYRFGYQGQFAEMDEETGWNAFELRMYEPWSPYIGMGNNPISLFDPTGGCTDGNGNPVPCPDGIPEKGNENTVILANVNVEATSLVKALNFDIQVNREGFFSYDYYGPKTYMKQLIDVQGSTKKFDTGWNRFTEGTVITNGITAVLSAELTGLFGLGAIGTRFFGAAGGILGATSQNVEYRITGYTKDVVEWYGIIRHNHVTGKTDFLNIGTSEPVSVIEGNVMIEYKITQQLPDGSSTSISFSEEAKVLH